MMDFKAQLIKDLPVFHNPGEFASMVNLWYCGEQYTVPAVIDHTAAADRQQPGSDHAEGINQIEALMYISHADLGFVPKKGKTLEVEEAGAVSEYIITKSSYEDGEIILELGALEE